MAPQPSPGGDPHAGSVSWRKQGWSLAAFGMGGLAFVFFPMVSGPLAILFAAMARSQREPRARAAMIVAVAGMVVGMALGALLWALQRG